MKSGTRNKMVVMVTKDRAMSKTPGTNTSRACSNRDSSSSSSTNPRPRSYHHLPRSQFLLANNNTIHL